MRKLVLTLLTSIITLCLFGCATRQNYAQAVNSWQGAKEQAVFRVWGYPNYIRKLDGGHKLLIYRTVDRGRYPTYTTPGYTTIKTEGNETRVTTVPGTTTGGGSYDFRCITWFEVNRHGRVVNTSFRGNGCTATKSFLQENERK